jgi:hypothetical protein
MDAHDEAVFRSAVAHVLVVGGDDILETPDRFGAMLSDMLGSQSGRLRAERSALVALVARGAAPSILDGSLTPARRADLTTQLRTTDGLDEASLGVAIDALADAGNRSVMRSTGTPTESSPPTTASPPVEALAADAAASVIPSPPESPPPHDPTAYVGTPADPSSVPPSVSSATPAHAEVPTPTGPSGPPKGRVMGALVAVSAVLVGAVVALIVILAFGQESDTTTASPAGTAVAAGPAVSTAPTASTTTTALDPNVAAQQADPGLYAAMQRFDSTLQQSAQGRAAVGPLVIGVQNCSVNPQDASQQIDAIVANRQSVINQVSAIPTSSPQAATLSSDLQAAIQASITADRHYRNWMTSLYTDYQYTDPVGCPSGSAPRDAEFNAGDAASAQASDAKATFVDTYNPIATAMGLRTWAEDEI